MTKEELLTKAIYIQFPQNYSSYYTYNLDNEILKLPLPKPKEMYDEWNRNTNHFTTQYHRLNTLPLLCKLLGIKYSENDFVLCERISTEGFDISLLEPKQNYIYEIYGYDRDEHFDNLTFCDITSNDIVSDEITDYHRLYKYPHECSRLINKTINNDKKLFISGDSQMIPNISFLSCFFKEVWYFDSRRGHSFSDKWNDVRFSNVLVELNYNNLTKYTDINLK